VIEVRQKFDRAKQVPDCALLPMPEKFGQGLVNGVLLGSKATDFPRLVEQPIVDLKICGHVHTVGHTIYVSKTMQRA
jgi:hypothetical protein